MKRIFAIPFLIFASFLVYFLAITPEIVALNKAKESFAKKDQEVKERQDYFTGLKNTLLELENYQETLQKIETSLPGEVSLASLLRFFDQKASNNGLVLGSITPLQGGSLAESEAEKLKEVPAQFFRVSLMGSVSSLEGFLKDIESSARLVDVQNIDLLEAKTEASSEINVSIKAYY